MLRWHAPKLEIKHREKKIAALSISIPFNVNNAVFLRTDHRMAHYFVTGHIIVSYLTAVYQPSIGDKQPVNHVVKMVWVKVFVAWS